MKVTGFLMVDDQGQEIVAVCDQPDGQPRKVFALRGWQRRRMVPIPCTAPELDHITGKVLMTLDDLCHGLSNVGVNSQNRPPSPLGPERIRPGGAG